MTATEIKAIADEVNQENIDRADADLDHVEIEILESAKEGSYSLDYTFVPNTDFSRVNEIRNQLIGLGFDVEITEGVGDDKDCLVLEIDWSKNIL
jgi:hypothetical protein